MITDISLIDIRNRTTSKVGVKTKNAISKDALKPKTGNITELDIYRADWEALSDFRERFQRATKYLRGDQWSDLIYDDKTGEYTTEEDYIKDQGKIPLKQNIIRPIVKSLLGLFRTDTGKSIVFSTRPNSAKIENMLSNALQYALHLNEAKEIDSRTFEYFMLAGLPIQKIGYDFIDEVGRYDVRIEYVDPNYIFFNGDIKDIRLTDLKRIGQIHDITLDEVLVGFAKTKQDKERLKKIYASVSKDDIQTLLSFTYDRIDNLNFYLPTDPSKCRVIEVWEKKAVDVIDYWDPADGSEGYWDGDIEELEQINLSRIEKYTAANIPEDEWLLIRFGESVAFKWFFKYMSPDGHILREGETPYEHGSHPFEMYPYPLISGEVWGLVEDIIDQQRYLNRLITLWDSVIGTSSKNTLIFDRNSLEGQTPEELGAVYREVGGVIVLDLKNGAQKPFTINDRMIDLGVNEMIGLQLKWVQDISGVQPSMQGQQANSGTPANRYAMEVNQATMNSKDLVDSFSGFRRRRDLKVLRTLMQFYKGQRYVAIAGDSFNTENIYDSEIARDYVNAFDIKVGQSSDSPTYKAWMDDMLKELVMNQLIDVETFFKHSNFPYSEAILEDIKNNKEQMAQGEISPQQAATNVNQSYQQASGVDPAKLAKIQQMVGR